MPSCAVKWCRSHTDMKHSGITFHKFPANRTQRGKWILAVRLERNEPAWMPCEFSKICSIHFRDEDIYMLGNGRRKRLSKSAVPICTMVSPVQPAGDLSGPSSVTKNINVQPVQKESSIPPKEVQGEVYLEENTNKPRLHISDCRCTVEEKIKLHEDCSRHENEVNLDIYSNADGKIIKLEVEDPDCSYVEEKHPQMIECPSCKYNFSIPTEILENEASLPASKKMKPSCSAPISVPSSEIESVFDIFDIRRLEKKLALKTALAKKRQFQLKNLLRQNKRSKTKISRLKHVIENLLSNRLGDSN